MNRLITALLIILAVLILLFPVIYLQIQNSNLQNQVTQLENQIDELENQTSELRNQIDDLEEQVEFKRERGVIEITKVEHGDGFAWVGGIALGVFVTVKNYGVNYVEGLTLSVGDAVHVVGLLQGESTKRVRVQTGSDYLGGGNFVVTLKLGNRVLDTEDFGYLYDFTPPF